MLPRLESSSVEVAAGFGCCPRLRPSAVSGGYVVGVKLEDEFSGTNLENRSRKLLLGAFAGPDSGIWEFSPRRRSTYASSTGSATASAKSP